MFEYSCIIMNCVALKYCHRSTAILKQILVYYLQSTSDLYLIDAKLQEY